MNRSVWDALGGNPLRFLASAWPWRSLAYLLTTVLVGLVSIVALFVVIGVGVLSIVVVVGLFVLGFVPRLAGWIATLERRRLGILQLEGGEAIPGKPSWRSLGYVVLLTLALWLVDLVVVSLVITTFMTSLLSPLLAEIDNVAMFGWDFDTAGEALPFALIATPVSYVLGCYLLTALAAGQSSLAHILLSPREEELEAHVSELRRSRLQLVDAFETERKRIERDLHDGVQQRMVALTMLLGRAELDVADGPGLDLVRQAHSEAESALADLREVVRGVHPRVLTDLGLAAAIREVADRMPLPVRVDIAIPERPEPQMEAAAYFVVSEALVNVAKHADATSASVQAWRHEDWLVVVITDDGSGGAAIGTGSGLSGLVTRLDALGGTLDVTSPTGGPTRVRMECPWQVAL
jgi:signal transduction histidine kinase